MADVPLTSRIPPIFAGSVTYSILASTGGRREEEVANRDHATRQTREPATLEAWDLKVYLNDADGDIVCKVLKDTGTGFVDTGMGFTIPAGTTPTLQSLTNVSLANGDDVVLEWDASAVSSISQIGGMSRIIHRVAGKSVNILHAVGGPISGANTTKYFGPVQFSDMWDTYDEAKTPILMDQTWDRVSLFLETNGRPDTTTYTLMVNGVASAFSFTVGTGVTGEQIYSPTPLALNAGDFVAWRAETGGGLGGIELSQMVVHAVSDTEGLHQTYKEDVTHSQEVNHAPGTTTDWNIYGIFHTPPASEALARTPLGLVRLISKVSVDVMANDIPDANAITLRKNGVDTPQALTFDEVLSTAIVDQAIVDFDADDYVSGVWTDKVAGLQATITGATHVDPGGGALKYFAFDGINDFMSIPDNALLDVDTGQVKTWIVYARPVPAGGDFLLNKSDGHPTQGWHLRFSGTNQVRTHMSDGVGQTEDNDFAGVASGVDALIGGVIDASADQASSIYGTSKSAPNTGGFTGSAANGLALIVGANQGGSGNFYEGRIYRILGFDFEISAAQLTALATEVTKALTPETGWKEAVAAAVSFQAADDVSLRVVTGAGGTGLKIRRMTMLASTIGVPTEGQISFDTDKLNDTQITVTVDSLDLTVGVTHSLRRHTSDLGINASAWLSTGTEIATPVATGDVVDTGRTEDTTYYYALISTNGAGSVRSVAVLAITTAPPKPTSFSNFATTVDSFTDQATDESGEAHKWYISDATSGLVPEGETIAGLSPLRFTFRTQHGLPLVDGVTYDRRVSAYSETPHYRESALVGPVSGQLTSAPPTAATIAELSAATTHTSLTVRISAFDATATEHDLYWGTGSILGDAENLGTLLEDNVDVSGGAPVDVPVSGLNANTTYYFVLVSRNVTGNTESNEAAITTDQGALISLSVTAIVFVE